MNSHYVLDLSRFTETHVHPVAKHIDHNGNEYLDECSAFSPNLYKWGVYLRKHNYQLQHIADCDSEEDASLVALALNHLINLTKRIEE